MANDGKGGQATTEPAATTPAATTGKETPAPAGAPAAATPAKDDAGKTTATPAKADEPGKGASTTEPGGKDGAATTEPKAPEKYELTVPEGADVFIDDAIIGEIATLAKAQKWTNEQAQAALDQVADEAAARSEKFREETVNDPIYGGDNLEATQQHAERALDRMWPKGSKDALALRKLLTASGHGNNRLILGGLANIGKLMAEDDPERGKGGGPGAKRDPATVLYGGKTS